MLTKLPRWVEVGGFWMASMAGAVNAVGLLGFKHQAVSHLTGTSSLLGVAMAELDLWSSVSLLLILLAFMLGASMSGALIDNAVLRLGRRYSVALAIEAGLLLLAMVLLGRGFYAGHILASAACGLQNGMVSTYSGAVVRTTHVTGLFTDLGTMFGARLRGHPLDRRRVLLYILLIAGFVLGSSVGAYAFEHLQFGALAIPATAAFALAVIYWIYWHRERRRERAEAENAHINI